MTINIAWRELYRAALLELCPESLPDRIDVAEKAIEQRLVELRQDDSGSDGESRELDDALRGLRVLAVTECKPPQPIQASSARGESRS